MFYYTRCFFVCVYTAVTLNLGPAELTVLEGDTGSPQGFNVSVTISNLPPGGVFERDVVARVSFNFDTAGRLSKQRCIIIVLWVWSSPTDSEDIGATDTTVVFPETGTSEGDVMQVTFYVLPDTLYESDEAFTVTLSAVTADMIGPNNTLTVTILNDDRKLLTKDH